MSREVVPRVLLYLSLAFFFLSTFSKASSHAMPDDCLEPDVKQLEDYLSELNLEDVPTIDTMIGGWKCPVAALPFGALKSDWSRLLLLRNAQPKDSILLEKLGRLFRILVIAYFQMEERLGVAELGLATSASSSNASSARETTTVSVNLRKETKKLDNLITHSVEANGILGSFASSTVPNKEGSIGTIKTERTTLASFNVTSEDKNSYFDTTSNDNISSTTVAFSVTGALVFSSTGVPVHETETTATAIVNTVSSDTTVGKQKYYTRLSDNYTSNDLSNEKTLRTSEPVALSDVKTEEERNGSRTFPFRGEIIPTTGSFTGNENAFSSSPSKDESIESISVPVTESTIEFSSIETSTPTTKPTGTGSVNSFSINAFSTVVPKPADFGKLATNPLREEEATASIFEISTTKFNDTKQSNFGKTNSRGDSPIPRDRSSSASSEEDRVDEGRRSKPATVRYRNVTDANVGKSGSVSSPEISDAKIVTERVHSDKIFDNGGMAGSRETFNRTPSDPRTNDVSQVPGKTPWYSWNSTVPRGKIKGPQTDEGAPSGNQFSRYMVISRKVAPTTPTAGPEAVQAARAKGSSGRPRKRGSLNTSLQKTFRWFYNFADEGGKYTSNDPVDSRGVHIDCNGGRDNETENKRST